MANASNCLSIGPTGRRRANVFHTCRPIDNVLRRPFVIIYEWKPHLDITIALNGSDPSIPWICE